MTHYLIFVAIGILMGLSGGLLGIGGAVIMIPALVLAFGENQHLYQAAAMICGVAVAVSATVAHKREDIHIGPIVRGMIPAAVAGVILGVLASNSRLFLGDKSYLLARTFGFFLLYVICHNVVKLYGYFQPQSQQSSKAIKHSGLLSVIVGMTTGFTGGLLGIGGGSICVPLQQVFMRVPLKNAIANSAATIIVTATVGAILKNATLCQHQIPVTESLKIAAAVIPSAVIASFAGARLMHILPNKYVRAVFIVMLTLASYKMLTA